MIKILHYGLSSNRGGIETYLLKISKMINKDMFLFEFIDDTQNGVCFKEELEALGFSIRKITPRSKNPYKNRMELEQLLDKERYDVVHCHLNTLSYFTLIEIAKKRTIPVIVHSRNAGASYRLHTRLLHYVNKIRLRTMTNVNRIAVSALAGNWLFGNSSFSVFNNGIDIDNFRFDEKIREQVRKKLNIDNRKVLLNVGAFLFAKNHDFLLHFFSKYVSEHKNAVLLLVGEGPLFEDIRTLSERLGVSDSVRFLGKRNDVNKIMMASDCLVFPSLYEGFPNVVLEAQTSGLPCVISNTITDEIVLSDICKRIPLGDLQQWKEEVEKAMNIIRDREEYSEQINRLGYSVQNEIKKLEKYYKQIVEDNAGDNEKSM